MTSVYDELLVLRIKVITLSESKVSQNKKAFCGTWILGSPTSNFNGFPPSIAYQRLIVDQIPDQYSPHAMTVERLLILSPSDSLIWKEVPPLNGKNTVWYYGKSKHEEIGGLTFTADGETMTEISNTKVVNTANNQEVGQQTTQMWELSDDKNMLPINVLIQIKNGPLYSFKAVYDKQ